MSALRSALRAYLELRRDLGYKLKDAGLQLPRFIDFLEARGASHITTALAMEWAQLSTAVQPTEWARRLGGIRGFARYCHASDPLTEIPPPGLLPRRATRARPYLYSDEEVQQLLAAALKLPTNWHRTALYPWLARPDEMPGRLDHVVGPTDEPEPPVGVARHGEGREGLGRGFGHEETVYAAQKASSLPRNDWPRKRGILQLSGRFATLSGPTRRRWTTPLFAMDAQCQGSPDSQMPSMTSTAGCGCWRSR